MKCKVLHGFAGQIYAGAKGTEINVPVAEAKSLAAAGIVEILEDYKPEIAYETAAQARKAMETKEVKAKKR